MSKWVDHEGGDAREKRYHEDVRAFLTSFVTGEDFDDDEVLKKLKTESSAWYEFRITFTPQHRVIGGFLRKGEFIALSQETRSRLDKNFAPSIHRASRIWQGLFDGHAPHSGERALLVEDFDGES